MSADKHKRRDRAFAFIRSLRTGWHGFPKHIRKARISGPLTPVMKYCIKKGYAKITRTKPGMMHRSYSRHTIFDAE